MTPTDQSPDQNDIARTETPEYVPISEINRAYFEALEAKLPLKQHLRNLLLSSIAYVVYLFLAYIYLITYLRSANFIA